MPGTSPGAREHKPTPFTVGPERASADTVAALLVLGLTLVAGGCRNGNSGPAAGPPPAVPVVVAVAERKVMPLELRAIGRIEAKETVAIKARVSGQIIRVRPGKDGVNQELDGQDVSADEILFEIDPAPYQASLSQAEANLARDQASLENAQADLARAETLIATKSIAQEQYELTRAKVKTLAAMVRGNDAAIAAAKVQLNYCTIHSPITGRAGELTVRFGNIVKADDAQPLLVINQLAPIYVSFTVPEQQLPQIRRYYQEQEQAHRTLTVRATPAGEQTPLEGHLTFIDNQVDAATGTIELMALFANADRRLWPGAFVDVVLQLATIDDAIVVPNQALQTSQNGQYVFVIQPDDTAEMRPIVKGEQVGEETCVVQGLQPGERVVIDGQMRLTPGARVDIKPPVKSPQEAAK